MAYFFGSSKGSADKNLHMMTAQKEAIETKKAIEIGVEKERVKKVRQQVIDHDEEEELDRLRNMR